MQVRHIVASIDDSDVARHALIHAGELANRAKARLTILTVRPAGDAGEASSRRRGGETRPRESFSWWRPELERYPALLAAKPVERSGVPWIEIPRFTEGSSAYLLVMGRKPHSRPERLFLGDTCDSVVRRSTVPVLMIPPAQDGVGRISVALDGSERGLGVLAFALNLAQAARSRLRVVTVERPREDESAELARSLPEGRSERLAQAIDRLRLEEAIAESLWEPASEATGGRPLTVLRGDPVEQIVEDLRRSSTDILAVGYPLGGPPGVVEGESVARRLVHLAPCSVLTVPL